MPTKQQQEDRIKELEQQIDQLKEELRQLETSEIVSNEDSSSRFFPKPIPNWQKKFSYLPGTSRVKHLKSKWVGATVHSYRGATFDELADVISRYQKMKLSQVIIIIGGFNENKRTNTLKGTNYWAQCNLGSEQNIQQRMHYSSLRKI